MVGSTKLNNHHYAIDAARLVEKCRLLLHSILELMGTRYPLSEFQSRAYQLAALSDGESHSGV
jgi:hypothetical protein